jgi:hypothetical protein
MCTRQSDQKGAKEMSNVYNHPQTSYPAYDLIVVGSGLAAVSLAQRVAAKNLKVLIVEGGAEEEREKYRLLTLNDEYGHFENHWSNHWIRAVGGTSRRWAGYLAALDERDFLGSKILPKWPIQYKDVHSFYIAAANFLGRSEAIVKTNTMPLLDGNLIFKPYSTGSPLRLPTAKLIKNSPNIFIRQETNVIRLMTKNRRSVNGLLVRAQSGLVELIEILPHQKIVLACGGLGNAQILMQPSDGGSAGVGNESGFVGKFLMEHPQTACGWVYLKKNFLETLKYFLHSKKFGENECAFTLPNQSYYSQNLLGCTITIGNIKEANDDFGRYWSKQLKSEMFSAFLEASSEQEPQANNTVSLINEKNNAGLFRLRTECVFSTLDLNTIYITTRLLAETLYRHGVGIAKIDNNAIYRQTHGQGHTMGTTRMGLSVQDSVCDKNCKVHNYTNLYLAGSSVFTTSGASGPTLTIVALSLRLADHLVTLTKKEGV